MEIQRLIAAGKNMEEVGRELEVSTATVYRRVRAALERFSA